MPAYLIANVNINDPDGFAVYQNRVVKVVRKFGGKFLVRGGKHEILEGQPAIDRSVVLEFPSFDDAKLFWNSPEYGEMKKLRAGTAKLDIYLVEGAV